MSIEKVKDYFEKLGLSDRITEFNTSSATVDLAAEALRCPPQWIAKTLSFSANGEPILIVCAGDTKIDNSKYKAQFGTKAKMLTYEEVDELVGHSVGGVCPFEVNDGVKVYLDVSLRRFDTIYPAAGSSNSAVRLSPEELEKYSNSLGWIDVCRIKETA